MYDPATISERIDRREIRSFTNSFRYSDGRTRHAFIRKNQYYGWVGLQPRDLCGYTVVQGREIYLQANPSSNAQYWGMGYTDSDNYLTVEQSGWDALSETTKRFIQEEAIKCQPLQNQISLTVSNKALGNMQ